ncbi:MAG: BamA/TamA family outer membrane protein, partial [Bacteroidota bacterium]
GVSCCLTLSLPAQGLLEKAADFFEFNLGRPAPDSNHFVTKVVIAPIATYEPSTSLGLGLGGKMLFKFRGSGPETRTSNLPLSVTYTLNNQFIFYSGYTVFFNQEKYLLKGNLIYSDFPFPYHGIGSRTSKEDRLDIAYQQFLFQPLLLKKLAPNFFVGGGIRYNTNFNTHLEKAKGELPKGYDLQDSLGSTSVGIEWAVTVDSRDNVLNATRGSFLEFTHGFYGKAFGGTHQFMLSSLNFRRYWKLSPNRPDVLALGLYGRFAWEDAPPLELSSLGGEELLRGYQEGRYRDRIALFTQIEYRWQTFDRIGFVFFGGAGDVGSRLGEFSFQNLKYSLGTGLRVKIIPSENLNVRFDYGLGFGAERDANFYLGIAESF